jgi:hypothetical protein
MSTGPGNFFLAKSIEKIGFLVKNAVENWHPPR